MPGGGMMTKKRHYTHSAKFHAKQLLRRLEKTPKELWTERDKRFMFLVEQQREDEAVMMYGGLRDPTTFTGLAVRNYEEE